MLTKIYTYIRHIQIAGLKRLKNILLKKYPKRLDLRIYRIYLYIMKRATLEQSYEFGPPSLEDHIVSVSAWNLWDEVVSMDVRLSFGLDEYANKVVTAVEYLSPVMGAEFTDLKVDVRTSLEKQGYTKFAEDVL